MVWSFAAKSPYPTLTGTEIIDGGYDAVRKMRYLNPDEVTGIAKAFPNSIQMMQGYRVVAEDAPKKVRWLSTVRAVPDYDKCGGVPYVSERLRDLIEQFEPGVHQFIPVDLYRPKAKEPFATHYWFVVCSRIDSVDAEHTTFHWEGDRSRGIGFWNGKGDQSLKLIFSGSQIGQHHVWIDQYLNPNWLYISDTFHDALIENGMTGWSGTLRQQV